MSKEDGLQWFLDAKNHDDYWIEKTKTDFAVAVDKRLKKQQINRAGLAERLKKSAAYITKLLRGDENLTIASMVRVARALDSELQIRLVPKSEPADWLKVIDGERKRPHQKSLQKLVEFQKTAE